MRMRSAGCQSLPHRRYATSRRRSLQARPLQRMRHATASSTTPVCGSASSACSSPLAGPEVLKLGFQAFIVVVGFLMLAGAVNTAIVGSNGVLNRVSEDGVLSDWFRAPHRRYGTTYRLITLIVTLQFLTIIGSRGDVY